MGASNNSSSSPWDLIPTAGNAALQHPAQLLCSTQHCKNRSLSVPAFYAWIYGCVPYRDSPDTPRKRTKSGKLSVTTKHDRARGFKWLGPNPVGDAASVRQEFPFRNLFCQHFPDQGPQGQVLQKVWGVLTQSSIRKRLVYALQVAFLLPSENGTCYNFLL